jgi:hypothetical protein
MPISDIQTDGSGIKVYDQNSKRISQMSSHNVEISNANGTTFVTEEGSWLKTYDENCKRISQRAK